MAKNKNNTNLIIGLVVVGILVVGVALYLSKHHSNNGGGTQWYKCSDNCAKPYSTGSVDNGDYETQSRCCSGCGVTGGACTPPKIGWKCDPSGKFSNTCYQAVNGMYSTASECQEKTKCYAP